MAKVDDRPVGFADIEIDAAGREAYLTYYVAPEYRGRGYGRELLVAIRDYLHQHSAVAQLQGSVDVENRSSRQALTAVGFKPGAKDRDGLIPYVLSLDR